MSGNNTPSNNRNTLPIGREAQVTAPATSANLGPGFDALGLALDWFDSSGVQVIDSGLEFRLAGEGSETLPRNEHHLVIRTVVDTLREFGLVAPGLLFESETTIPLARGLGSSSAAIVSGLLLAWGLAKPDQPLDREWAYDRAYKLEGHGDNVGPAIMGGFTITWSSRGFNGAQDIPQIRTSAVRDDVRALALIPPHGLRTESARAVLPKMIPMNDAIANSARTALLVHALADDPSLLFQATDDRLHQDYRAQLLPESHALLNALRSRGHAAVISGAGPTVLVLHCADDSQALLREIGEMPEARGLTAKVLRTGPGARILR